MRDSKRITHFCNVLWLMWTKYVPDWRFGQLMTNIFGDEDIFYMEEDEIERRILKYFNNEEKHHGINE